jgi:hypothetical protein
MVAAELANLKTGQHARPNGLTQAAAAEMLHVSHRAVRRASTILRDGTPEDIASVKSGGKTVGEVARKIKESKESAPWPGDL